MFDYIIVGAGLFGSVIARKAMDSGKTVLVIDKRDHIGGNVYTQDNDGIQMHMYGAHIFHTNYKRVWDFMQRFATFNRFTNSPIANYKGKLYSLPFNMLTFNQMWGVRTPKEAADKIEEQRKEITGPPMNLEEQAISLVGRDIYEALVMGYTEKQWGRSCRDLPPDIIKRLPVRMTFDNNYFNAKWQGIPIGGYTKMVDNMLKGASVILCCDYLKNKESLDQLAHRVVYTGPIDAYFDYKFGRLEYRSLRFETTIWQKTKNKQGVAVMNYTGDDKPWTRIIEHKWFDPERQGELDHTVTTKEFSAEWKPGLEPYYPINDQKNEALAEQYRELARHEKDVFFGGRLGEYKYYDMDQVIHEALNLWTTVLEPA